MPWLEVNFHGVMLDVCYDYSPAYIGLTQDGLKTEPDEPELVEINKIELQRSQELKELMGIVEERPSGKTWERDLEDIILKTEDDRENHR